MQLRFSEVRLSQETPSCSAEEAAPPGQAHCRCCWLTGQGSWRPGYETEGLEFFPAPVCLWLCYGNLDILAFHTNLKVVRGSFPKYIIDSRCYSFCCCFNTISEGLVHQLSDIKKKKRFLALKSVLVAQCPLGFDECYSFLSF